MKFETFWVIVDMKGARDKKNNNKKTSVERYKLHAVAERLIKQETNH